MLDPVIVWLPWALVVLLVISAFLYLRHQEARSRQTTDALGVLVGAVTGRRDRATTFANLLTQTHAALHPLVSLAYLETPGTGLALIEAAGVEDFRALTVAPYTDPVIVAALENQDDVWIGPPGVSAFWETLARAHGTLAVAAARLGAPRSAEGLILLAYRSTHQAQAAAPALRVIAGYSQRLLADFRSEAEQHRRIQRLLDELQDNDVIARSSAHDIGNHLTVIGADVQRLGRAAETASPEGQALAKVDRELDVVRDMLRDVFEPNRQIQIEPLDARLMLNAAQGLLTGRRGRKVEVILEEPPPGSLMAQGNEVALLRIFGNLINNALRHNPVSRPLTLTLSARPFGEWIQFFVADDGRGIAVEDQEHLFEPGWSAGQAGQAGQDRRHGLGLWSTRRLVESLGGEIGVVSRPQEGAAFWFTIPRATPARES